MAYEIINDDVVAGLRKLKDCSFDTCITSPPYYRLRDYGVSGQIGLESTPEEYVKRIVEVFREVRRVLKNDGTLWLVIGDSYAAKRKHQVSDSQIGDRSANISSEIPEGCKGKDLIGIPWLVALALRNDGWYLRQDIIWSKPNAMPESVKDRCTRSHEYIFLFSKSPHYYFDSNAIKEPANSFKRQSITGIQPPKVQAMLDMGLIKKGREFIN